MEPTGGEQFHDGGDGFLRLEGAGGETAADGAEQTEHEVGGEDGVDGRAERGLVPGFGDGVGEEWTQRGHLCAPPPGGPPVRGLEVLG